MFFEDLLPHINSGAREPGATVAPAENLCDRHVFARVTAR